jgi:hypothetical protein
MRIYRGFGGVAIRWPKPFIPNEPVVCSRLGSDRRSLYADRPTVSDDRAVVSASGEAMSVDRPVLHVDRPMVYAERSARRCQKMDKFHMCRMFCSEL